MKIYVNLKQLSNRKPRIKQETYFINDNISSVKDLIQNLVTIQVEKFNNQIDSQTYRPELFDYITASEIKDKSSTGKVSFGALYNTNKQDLGYALDNAIESFKDGIYCLFINNTQFTELDKNIVLREEDVVTVIRLTMLAGRMW